MTRTFVVCGVFFVCVYKGDGEEAEGCVGCSAGCSAVGCKGGRMLDGLERAQVPVIRHSTKKIICDRATPSKHTRHAAEEEVEGDDSSVYGEEGKAKWTSHVHPGLQANVRRRRQDG